MKRFIILFGITFIIVMFILFYDNDKSNYLGIYENSFIIEYDFDGASCDYKSENNIFNIEKLSEMKWKYTIKENGIEIINYECYEEDTLKYSIKYEFEVSNNKIYWTKGEGVGLLDYPNPY